MIQFWVKLSSLQHVINHALEPHHLTVSWGVNSSDTISFKFTDLPIYDHATTAAKYPNLCSVSFTKHVDHVFEKLGMATLVGTNGDAVGVLLNRRINNFTHRSVVAKVNHLNTRGLKDSSHHVDRRIMTIKQAGCSDKTKPMAHLRDRTNRLLQRKTRIGRHNRKHRMSVQKV